MITAAYMASAFGFRPEFIPPSWDFHSEVQPIDAPEIIPSGSHVYQKFSTIEGGYSLPSSAQRLS